MGVHILNIKKENQKNIVFSKKLFFSTYLFCFFAIIIFICNLFYPNKNEDIFFVNEFINFCGFIIILSFLGLNYFLFKSKMNNNSKATKYENEKKERTEDVI